MTTPPGQPSSVDNPSQPLPHQPLPSTPTQPTSQPSQASPRPATRKPRQRRRIDSTPTSNRSEEQKSDERQESLREYPYPPRKSELSFYTLRATMESASIFTLVSSSHLPAIPPSRVLLSSVPTPSCLCHESFISDGWLALLPTAPTGRLSAAPTTDARTASPCQCTPSPSTVRVSNAPAATLWPAWLSFIPSLSSPDGNVSSATLGCTP